MTDILEDYLISMTKDGINLIKACTKCNTDYPYTSEYFSKDPRTKYGLAAQCKTCTNNRGKKWAKDNLERATKNAYNWRQRNPHKVRVQSLKRVNFTPELYDSMLELQNNLCALCGTSEPGGMYGVFHADHDHATGKPRGLLCWTCNSALGLVESKSPEWMDKARKYIDNGGFHSANSQEIVTQPL